MNRDELWDQVRKSALTNSIVSHRVARYIDGDCALDEAMMMAVLALARANESYQRMVTNMIAGIPASVA